MSDSDLAQPGPIQCLVNQQHNWHRSGGSASAAGSSVLWLPGFSDGGNPGWDNETQAPRFWVLDRANPLQKPQSFVGSDSTTVPAGLIPLMDNQHILVAAVLASSTYRVPQGPLYRFLMANGAGTVLATVENLNTGMACGIRCMFSYVLVSVAGGNEGPGIEYLDLPAPLTYAVSTSPEAGDQHYSGGVSFAVFELVQMDGGLYFPTRSLYPTGG